MKILKSFNDTNAIDKTWKIQIQQGRWYHTHRICIIKRDAQFAIVSMNIFERALSALLNVLHIDNKNVTIDLDSKTLQRLRKFKAPKKIAETTPPSKEKKTAPIPINENRDRYKSFLEYKQERDLKNEPIDLLVGRGTLSNKNTPKLNKTRYVPENGIKSYNPFTIDIDPQTAPDLRASITEQKDINYFPNESIDDIYLERIYPTQILQDIRIYFNAARILKVGGTLVADFNDGQKEKSYREGQIKKLSELFKKNNLPFFISLDSKGKNNSRNELKFDKFICIKLAEYPGL